MGGGPQGRVQKSGEQRRRGGAWDRRGRCVLVSPPNIAVRGFLYFHSRTGASSSTGAGAGLWNMAIFHKASGGVPIKVQRPLLDGVADTRGDLLVYDETRSFNALFTVANARDAHAALTRAIASQRALKAYFLAEAAGSNAIRVHTRRPCRRSHGCPYAGT